MGHDPVACMSDRSDLGLLTKSVTSLRYLMFLMYFLRCPDIEISMLAI